MKRKIYRNKWLGKIIALAMILTVGLHGIEVYAAGTTTYQLSDTSTEKIGNVTAKFTIGDTELEELGYTTTVSIPTQITLALSDGKFTGSDYIGVSGILDSSQKINISVDSSNEAYKIIEGPNNFTSDLSSDASDKFSITLSKQNWSHVEASLNLKDKTDGKAYSAWKYPGSLSVSINGKAFIPIYKGSYTTTIPLSIELTGA